MRFSKKSGKRIVRIAPYNRYDLESLEIYLSEMARKGLMIKHLGILSVFIKCETADLSFRIEPMTQYYDPTAQTASFQKSFLFDETGWNYVCSYAGAFTILCREKTIESSSEIDMRELNSDNQYENLDKKYTFRKLFRRYHRKPLILYLVILIMLLYLVFVWIKEPRLLYLKLISNNASLLGIYLVIYSVFDLLENKKERVYLYQLCNAYEVGIYYTKKDPDRKQKSFNSRYIAKYVGAVLCSFLLFQTILPHIEIYTTTNLDDNLNILPKIRQETLDEETGSNRYPGELTEKHPSFLVPVQMHLEQTWDQTFDIYLNVDYYELRYDFLAEHLFQTLLEDKFDHKRFQQVDCLLNNAYDNDLYVDENVSYEKDRITLLYLNHGPYAKGYLLPTYLLGISRNKVILIEYCGTKDLKGLVEYVEDIL